MRRCRRRPGITRAAVRSGATCPAGEWISMSECDRSAPDMIRENGRSPATPEGSSVRPVSIPEPELLDPESILDCYERARLPAPTRKGRAEPAQNLLALLDRYDAFILDGYGVINLGPEPIPGIGDTVRALRAAGREVMVLTNGAGRPSRDDRAPLRGVGPRHSRSGSWCRAATRWRRRWRRTRARDCGA